MFKILWLLFFIEVQPAKRHGESSSTASQPTKSQNKQSASPFTKTKDINFIWFYN